MSCGRGNLAELNVFLSVALVAGQNATRHKIVWHEFKSVVDHYRIALVLHPDRGVRLVRGRDASRLAQFAKPAIR
jgi:hypothetical protein